VVAELETLLELAWLPSSALAIAAAENDPSDPNIVESSAPLVRNDQSPNEEALLLDVGVGTPVVGSAVPAVNGKMGTWRKHESVLGGAMI